MTPVSKFLLSSLPGRLDNLRICEFVEDTIAPEYDEIIIVLDLEALDIWCSNDNFWIALVLRPFRLNIAKRSTHTQSPRKHSVWPQQYLLSHHSRFGIFILDSGDGLGLVDAPTCCDDAMVLFFVVGLVVLGQGYGVTPTFTRHDGAAITYVSGVADVIDE